MEVLDLHNIVNSTLARNHSLPGYEGTTAGLYGRPTLGLDCDEIYPNLLIGDFSTAKNRQYLQRIGITHVLNAAEGVGHGMVDPDPQFYHDIGIAYLGLPLVDSPVCNLMQYSIVFGNFINDAITRGGKILIHCLRGRSRSPTIAIAYLKIHLGMPVPMALKMCCKIRQITPNDGFLCQLCNLENCLN